MCEHLERRADVGDALGEAGVELVWLGVAIILGAGSTSFELIRHLVDRVPVIPIPSWMNHPISPIAVSDVLHYLKPPVSREPSAQAAMTSPTVSNPAMPRCSEPMQRAGTCAGCGCRSRRSRHAWSPPSDPG